MNGILEERQGKLDRRDVKADEGRQGKFLDRINKINGIGEAGNLIGKHEVDEGQEGWETRQGDLVELANIPDERNFF
jgi:hypothetical protein